MAALPIITEDGYVQDSPLAVFARRMYKNDIALDTPHPAKMHEG